MIELSTADFANQLLQIIPELMRQLFRHQNEAIAKGLVTMPQFLIMEYLTRQGDARMKDLADFMHVTMATMTGIVDRLVRDGYAKRLLDSSDRRLVKVALTPKGLTLAQKVQKERRGVIIEIFEKITSRDRQEYLRILRKIHQELKNKRAEKH